MGIRFPASVRDFSVLQNFQKGPGTHKASSSIAFDVPSDAARRSGRKADDSIASNSEVEIVEVYLHSSYVIYGLHRDKFT
jgi:hypothetical protein